MKIFSIDGSLIKYGTILFDMIALSLLWLLISIISFGILIGPATTALYYSAHYSIIQQHSSALKCFFSAFKSKFKYAMLGWLIVIIIIVLSSVAINLINVGALPTVLFPIYVSVLIYISMMIPYYIALTIMTKMKLKTLIKYSFLLSIKHLFITVLLLGIIVASSIILYLTNFLTILVIPAAIGLVSSYFIIDKAFKKYDFSDFESKEKN